MTGTYVEVHDEPRHRHRFEDALVRVYDVLIPPTDTTLYHRHTEDTFYVAVNEATVFSPRLPHFGVEIFIRPQPPVDALALRHAARIVFDFVRQKVEALVRDL